MRLWKWVLATGMSLTMGTVGQAQEEYNTNAMADFGIEANEFASYDSLETIVYRLMDQYDIDQTQVGFAYTNFINEEAVYINEDEQMIVASMYKVPMVAMYIDLIEAGYLEWDTLLPYSEDYYQDGGGTITADDKQEYYTLEELMQEAVIHSDNTAAMMMFYYYLDNFGNFRESLMAFIDYYDVPDYFFTDNYGSAYMMNMVLSRIAHEPQYMPLIEWMKQSEPKQLFSLFVEDMATKYGQYENMLNDSGIYYEGDKPVYSLVMMVRDREDADLFIAELNLRVNEWVKAHS